MSSLVAQHSPPLKVASGPLGDTSDLLCVRLLDNSHFCSLHPRALRFWAMDPVVIRPQPGLNTVKLPVPVCGLAVPQHSDVVYLLSCRGKVLPSPATHAILLQLKAGESV